MNLLEFFHQPNKKSAKIAKERLQIIVSHQRSLDHSGPDFLPELRQELLDVIRKYVQVEPNEVQVSLQKEQSFSVLELNVTIPENIPVTMA